MSVIFVVDPVLTGLSVDAREFIDAAVPLLQMSLVTVLGTEEACDQCSPAPGDAVVVLNSRRPLPDAVRGVLDEAVENGAVIFPVALGAADRSPPLPVTGRQSFDVTDALRRRDLPASSVRTVAEEFARRVLAQMLPTMVPDRMRLFLSYRRHDGEESAALLDRELSARHPGSVFRDLIDIDASQDAQRCIDESLDVADVLVLLDTFSTGESPWVQLEIAEALARKIPIVWVQLGPEESGARPRPQLPVRPQTTPHVRVPEEAIDPVRVGAVADEILAWAFTVAQEHARSALASFRGIRAGAKARGKKIEVLDGRRLIYQVSDPTTSSPWPQRPRTDVLQVFGRHPRDEDRRSLVAWLEAEQMGPHDRACRAYDAAVLLDPLPMVTARAAADGTIVASARDYLARVQPEPLESAGGSAPHGPWLLLLGSHPEGVEQGHATAAAETVVRVWLERGGRVAMGGHPTFVPMAVRQATRHRWVGEPRVRVYQSDYFPARAALQDAAGELEVIVTQDAGTRAASLTVMRHRMVRDLDYAAVVAIGGRTAEEGTHQPGLEEELQLGREAGLRAYLVGAAGGYTAFIADKQARERYASLGNTLSVEENERIRTSEDYEAISETVWADAQRTADPELG
ncbi:SLOG domain-containing protein [Blastococcus sp. SYSU DS0619]